MHCSAISPDDRWALEVTKRMEPLGTVEVRLRVSPTTGNIGSSEFTIDRRDMWGDIVQDSYAVKWLSETAFEVGDKEPGSAPRWKGIRVNGFWNVEELP